MRALIARKYVKAHAPEGAVVRSFVGGRLVGMVELGSMGLCGLCTSMLEGAKETGSVDLSLGASLGLSLGKWLGAKLGILLEVFRVK